MGDGRHKILKIVALALAVSLCPFVSTFATMFIPKSENQMILDAEWICAVTVLELRSVKSESAIITKARVQPIECYKGGSPDPFVVKWPGGVYRQGEKTYKTVVAGTPHLQKGESVVLYLWRSNPQDDFTVLSWVNGVIPLEKDPVSNKLAIRKASTHSFESKSKDSKKASSKKTDLKPNSFTSLQTFKEKVQGVLKDHPQKR